MVLETVRRNVYKGDAFQEKFRQNKVFFTKLWIFFTPIIHAPLITAYKAIYIVLSNCIRCRLNNTINFNKYILSYHKNKRNQYVRENYTNALEIFGAKVV